MRKNFGSKPWCSRRCLNLRIDTHRDNYPMQRAIEKNGFVRCEIIHLASDGSPRIAYQKASNESVNRNWLQKVQRHETSDILLE